MDIGNTVAIERIENIVCNIEGVVEVKVIGDLASSTFDDAKNNIAEKDEVERNVLDSEIVEGAYNILRGEGVVESDDNVDLDSKSPALKAIMRMWLGRGEGNVRLIKNIEKKPALPLGKKTAVVMKTPKPSLRKVQKTASASKKRKNIAESELKVEKKVFSMINWWERKAESVKEIENETIMKKEDISSQKCSFLEQTQTTVRPSEGLKISETADVATQNKGCGNAQLELAELKIPKPDKPTLIINKPMAGQDLDHMITDFGNQPIGEGHSDRPSHVGGTDTEKIGQPSLMEGPICEISEKSARFEANLKGKSGDFEIKGACSESSKKLERGEGAFTNDQYRQRVENRS